MGALITVRENRKTVVDIEDNDVVTIIIDTDKPIIEYHIENADCRILVYIRYEKDVSLKETGFLLNSHAHIQYVELSNHCFVQNNSIEVKDYSSLEVNTIYLGINEKKIDFDLINASSDTEVVIRNNVVCLEKADLVLNVIGTILKGSKRAKCHQKNNCLTIDSPKRAEVLPVLKIDENDVEASHSLSSGTIDEEVLFYMNSRGLSKKDALNLMVLSYLLPNEEEFTAFEGGQELYELSLRRVKEVCSM